MLTAVAVIGSTLVAWSNSKLATFETGLAISASNKTNNINENLSIENIWFCLSTCNEFPNPDTRAVIITLTNTGYEGLTVTNIKIFSRLVSPYNYPQTASILPGNSYSFAHPSTQWLNFPWLSRDPVTIQITTARGLIYTTQMTPP
jgi:hypothetical protein